MTTTGNNQPNQAIKISIAGSAITQFGELWDRSLLSLGEEAITAALENAELLPTQVDLVVIGNMASQAYTSQAHLGAYLTQLFPHHPMSWKVEAACASGGLAMISAIHSLLSGECKTVVVIGVEKMTDLSTAQTTQVLAGAADLDHEPSASFPSLYALLAKEHMRIYGTTNRELAAVAVKNHLHAMNNPKAQFHKQITIEDVLSSPIVSDPLHMLDCSPISDGAAAVVLTSSPKPGAVQIGGWGVGHDHLPIAKRDHRDRLLATQIAMQRATAKSGISQLDFEIMELHDCFTIAEIMAVEDLGFCVKGSGSSWIQEHQAQINTSGGLKACGHPVGATGVKQIAWCHAQMMTKNIQTSLTHNVGGSGGTAVVHHLVRSVE